jgi:hypothetical protein
MRTIKPIATAPVLDLAPQDVATLLDELPAYHAIYSPLLQRREQRGWSGKVPARLAPGLTFRTPLDAD